MEHRNQLGDPSEDQERQDDNERHKDLPLPILVGRLIWQSQTLDLEVNITIATGEDDDNDEVAQQMVAGSCQIVVEVAVIVYFV